MEILIRVKAERAEGEFRSKHAIFEAIARYIPEAVVVEESTHNIEAIALEEESV